MVFVRDEGATFDAPIEDVWEYIFSGEAHDANHKTTKNPKFGKVSDITILYGADRNFRGKWAPHQLRITMVPPVTVVTEWLDGVLAGSKVTFLYSPQGAKTRIDAYGEFTSKTLAPAEVEAAAREWLSGEFDEDAPAVREFSRKKRAK
jgi:hypothetical protein